MSANIALAPFLLQCPSVHTLGIRPCIDDYDPAERALIRNARRIFFPTPRFLGILESASIPTFPSPQSYRYPRSRVLQALLFQFLEWPSARTRLYFGNRQKERILKDHRMPFDALAPNPRSGGAHRIESLSDLESVVNSFNPLLIREAIPWEDRIRLTAVQHECLAAHQMTAGNASSEPWKPIPVLDAGLAPLRAMNRRLTELTQLDDIVIEWGHFKGRWHIIEITSPPLHIRTCNHIINRHEYICELIVQGLL